MFLSTDIKADRLPTKTLCLTFDDGPGQDTAELDRFLFEQGIAAAFFVVGRHVEQHPEVLPRLHGWGHIVGNQTYSHAGLAALAEDGGDVVEEARRTDALIRPYAAGPAVFLRPPYGSWRGRTSADNRARQTALVAHLLNRSGHFRDYVGPVHWDVVGEDWECWRCGVAAVECARRHLDEIERIGRGIVLMHDSSDDEALRKQNRTIEMTRLLLPALRDRGYRFIRLDAIPQVQSATRVSAEVTLWTCDNRYLSRRPASDEIMVADAADGFPEAFGIVNLGGSKVALRAVNGLYLSPRQGSNGELRADRAIVGARESLEMEPVAGGRVALRTPTAHT
jgi:peptidoglycan/xylan/chitin deacetylase (PgdA/CDA1 family)